MRPAVSYTPYDKSKGGESGNIITFAQFEEDYLLLETRNLLSENRDDIESDNKYDYNSTMPPLISYEEMDVMTSGNESNAEPMSTEMLEDICDSSHYCPSINKREARYKIGDHIKQSKSEWKGTLLSMRNMGKGLHKVFKAIINEILQVLSIWGESGSEVSYFVP